MVNKDMRNSQNTQSISVTSDVPHEMHKLETCNHEGKTKKPRSDVEIFYTTFYTIMGIIPMPGLGFVVTPLFLLKLKKQDLAQISKRFFVFEFVCASGVFIWNAILVSVFTLFICTMATDSPNSDSTVFITCVLLIYFSWMIVCIRFACILIKKIFYAYKR